MTSIWTLRFSDEQAVRFMTTFALIGIMLDSAEMLISRGVYAPNGMFTWQNNRLDYAEVLRRPLDGLFERFPFVYLVFVQLVCAIAAVIPGNNYSTIFIAAIILIRVLSIIRNGHQGREGADHLLLILLSCSVLYSLAPGLLVKRAILWFIAGETILAYVTSGVIKTLSPQWRRGVAIRNILSTKLFGNVLFERALGRHQWLGVAMCWTVILFELSAPLMVLTSYRACLVFVSCGVLFHLGIAITQGLNLFVWVFFATYSSLLITARDVSPYLLGSR